MEWTCQGLLLCMLLSLRLISGVLANDEGDALISLKANLLDPNDVMLDWEDNFATPCKLSHITCRNGSVVKINLANSGLYGTLASEIKQLKNLNSLELYNNSITGNIPVEIGNLTSLVSLDLYSNNFSGHIPETLGNLIHLTSLQLNNNNLSGQIPRSLTNLSVLQVLNFSNNNLSGEVPSSGSFSQFNITSFANNPSLCGPVTSVSCPASPSQPVASGKSSSHTATVVGAVSGALLFVVSVVGLAWWCPKKSEEYFFNVPGEEDLQGQLGLVKRFSFEELLIATDNFSNKHILGRGGFAIVYKGRLADSSLVAIKRMKKESIRCEEFQFQAEVQIFSRAVHMNLLRLCGYCTTPTERLLVYPYMANGSVASCLREGLPSKTLDWPTRRRIALASANVLSYLHDHCDPKIIHRDVKAANVLLDEKFEPFLGDFGLARLMDHKETHVTTVVRGTIGHIAPEYLFTQKFTEKTDVFGYGVMLLELITGQRAFDLACVAHEDEIVLQEWVKMHLKEKNLKILVDPNLEDKYVDAEVEELSWIALICTQNSPTERPTMAEVVRMLEADCHFEKWEQWQKFDMMHQKLTSDWQYYQPQIPHSTSTCNLGT